MPKWNWKIWPWTAHLFLPSSGDPDRIVNDEYTVTYKWQSNWEAAFNTVKKIAQQQDIDFPELEFLGISSKPYGNTYTLTFKGPLVDIVAAKANIRAYLMAHTEGFVEG